ncbi:ABC transporter substrate-binding protein [Polycladidibacter stylochi]|uniref:ABC transporter substrate-binding protein n=1 Tax=Polycladidibacter stylochi TaxID=1807766 RepID=UPI00082CE33D|nr:MqnA/MqnD/SBP family protein [Pseudovibrio stylochi]
MHTRRSFLTHSAAFTATYGLLGSTNVFASEKLAQLKLYGPPAGPSAILSYIAQKQLMSNAVGKVDFATYKSPDSLRAGFLSGEWQLAGTPSYVAANLANKGLPVKLLNIMTWGMLNVLSYDEKVKRPEDLAGQTIGMFFKNDMPDLVFTRIMKEKGLTKDKDYKVQYVSTPFEALQLLLTGRIQHCVLSEPAVTGALVKSKKLGKKIYKAFSLSDQWAAVTGGPARFPMAGMMVHNDLVNQHADVVEAFQNACETSVDAIAQNPQEAAKIASAHLKLPAPIIMKSLPNSNLTATRASTVREEIEQFYTILAEDNPAIIGGKLPDTAFYY